MSARWIPGNDFRLLENGEQFYPRVFECISGARQEVVLETFILFEDKVGLQLHEALVAAARRGVQVDVTIDGWGSPNLSDQFIATLTEAGVRLHVFDPNNRLLGRSVNMLRRMHRKIVVVDGETAFVGGINYSADHLADDGPEGKQDYAVEIHGPLVADIHRFTHGALANGHRYQRQRQWWRTPQAASQHGAGSGVGRSRGRHLCHSRQRRPPERYRAPLPDRDPRGAASGHHRQRLLLSGLPTDQGNVALNLESNVIIRDRAFNEQLSGRLEQMMRDSCRQVDRQELGKLTGWKLVRGFFVFHFIRRYPGWASWLPRHMPRLHPATMAPTAAARQVKEAP